MASTTFTDGQTPILASWLNDVNNAVYNHTFPTPLLATEVTYVTLAGTDSNVQTMLQTVESKLLDFGVIA